jgi:leader peptidase (prepilin peptidase)/N-methyltransferase
MSGWPHELQSGPARVTALAALLVGALGVAVGGLIRLRGANLVPAGVAAAPAAERTTQRVPPMVLEVVTGLLFALAVICAGVSAVLPAYLWFLAAAVVLTVVDVQHQLLPRRIVWPALAGGGLLLLIAAAATSSWDGLLRAALASAVLLALHLLLALISPQGVGMGDVRLASVTGLYLGWVSWQAVAIGAVGAFALQAVLAVPLLLARRADRHAQLPFGPAMLAAAALTVGISSLVAR